jgi:hypothetical protein
MIAGRGDLRVASPIGLSALEHDRCERITAGKLLDAALRRSGILPLDADEPRSATTAGHPGGVCGAT